MITKETYNMLVQNSRSDSKKILSELGFFKLTEDEKSIPRYEEILWNLAKKYALGEIQSTVFNAICDYYNRGYISGKLSSQALTLVISGDELDYYTYLHLDHEKLQQINEVIKRNLIIHFGPSIGTEFKI
jgi:hypothetical protein